MDVFVSVVVPVFNVEPYLKKCIDSLLAQTVDSFEIILVDDGSSDNCPKICDEYGKSHSNIKVIHKANGGLPSARNAGIKASCGKYIAFCDSDDMMKPDMLKKMTEAAEKYNADAVMCGYETFPNKIVTVPSVIKEKVITPEEFIASNDRLHSNNELCFSWRFIAKRSLIEEKKLMFDEEVFIGEDFLFNLSLIMESKRIYVLNDSLYLYRKDNQNSIMSKKYKKKLENYLQIQYLKKLELSEKYGLNRIKSWQEDMAWYYVTNFGGMLFRNALNGPQEDMKPAVKRAIRLDLLRDNYSRCLPSFYKYGVRYGIFFLACYFKIDFLVYYFVKKLFA